MQLDAADATGPKSPGAADSGTPGMDSDDLELESGHKYGPEALVETSDDEG